MNYQIPALILLVSSQLHGQNAIQPWSGFAVHDAKRPNPVKVTNAQALFTSPPSDAIVILGSDESHKMTKPWPMKNGVMTASKIGDNSTSDSFSDCQVHIEWRVPKEAKVDGQKGGNSGLFLMGLYEIQIQESHTNVTYADGQAAAVYGQFPPLVNPARPQGEWQSYDITFTAPRYSMTDGKLESPAKVTVIFNGVVVHANKELKGPTKHKVVTSYPEAHPKRAPHKLQWHQDPIEFRNFWVRDLTIKKSE